MSPTIWLPWQRPLPSNGALYIQQLWAAGGRTRETNWWNLVNNSILGPQWQSRDQILKILKFKMADGRHVWKYYKCHNSLTNGPTETQLGWSDPIISSTCPPRFGCHRNGRCLATAHGTYCSYGRLEAERRTREPISIKFGTQQHVRTSMTVTWLNIKIFKIQNGGRPPCWKIFEMS